MIFIARLPSESYSDIWTRLFSKLEHNKDITIQTLITECNNLLSIKRDTMLVQKLNTSSLTTNVQAKKEKKPPLLHSHMPYHNDTIIKTQEDFFINICTSHFICKVWKGYSRFVCERELETEQKLQYFDPTLMAVSVVSFSFSRAAQPEARGLTLLAFSITSYSATSLDPNSIGGPKPLRLGVAFLTTSRL